MSGLPVTDQDLMLYVDGELDAQRVADVEAELARSPRARELVASIQHAGALVRAHADERASAAGADGIADLVMSRIDAETAANVVPLPDRSHSPRSAGVRQPSSRSGLWYAVGGLAAAAAAALVVWRLVGADLTPQALNPPHPSVEPPSPAGPEVASARSAVPDADQEPSVSVDAVDFGARTGTIFYVPADKGTTTIVWLSDEESGGD